MKAPALPKVRAARDALFGARASAAPAQQAQIDAILLPSIEADLRAGRVAGGRHSVDKLLAGIGPAAAPMLVSLLEDPKVPFAGVVDALDRVADAPARERAGAALVKRAGMSAEIPVALWRALGTIGGRTASAFLMQEALGPSEQDAVSATQALQQRRDPSLLPMALGVAGDPRANKAVRDEMFGLVEKIGGPEAQRGLVRIIAADPTELVRYRAYEAALAVGKAAAIAPALEAFPEKAAYKKDDVQDFLVKDISKIGPEARPALARALASPSALARMTAVLAYEAPLAADPHKSLGGAADAPAVLKLSGDKGTVRGFPPGDSVGKEAARVGAVLQKRVGS
jgi:HEAT repeat protein